MKYREETETIMWLAFKLQQITVVVPQKLFMYDTTKMENILCEIALSEFNPLIVYLYCDTRSIQASLFSSDHYSFFKTENPQRVSKASSAKITDQSARGTRSGGSRESPTRPGESLF